MDEYVIDARGIRKSFPAGDAVPEEALRGIDMTAPAGQLTALIGPDGAGKTTFLRILCGLMKPTAGTVSVLGTDVTKTPQQVQERLSYMPQKFGLYEDLTVWENMDLYADLHGIPREARPARYEKLLHMTGLSPFTERLAGKLSGGMKQKLGLACTLVRTPDLLILDEPTVGVDPLSRKELWEILLAMKQEEHLSVLVTTPYMDEAALCDRVYLLNHGRFLFRGTPEQLRETAQGFCYGTKPPENVPTRMVQSRLLTDPAVIDAVPSGGMVRFITRVPDGALPGLSELRLSPQPMESRLEDGFMMLLKEDAEKEKGDVPLYGTDKVDISSFDDPSSHDTVITVRHLVKKFGDFTAVDDTNFTVHRGEIFGLLGPNGAGKTTTFKMLCGLLPATGGELSVAGVDLRTARTQARAHIGYVAQKFSLYSAMTVFENLRFFGGIYGLSGKRLRERIAEVMEEFDLTEKQHEPAGTLPGGFKQRLSMAAALIHQPKILFLDEPTSGIDPIARRRFWQQITALAAAGTTIIITTHFMEEAEYCDRMMIQDQGRLLILGRPSDIRKEMGRPDADMNEIFISIVEKGRSSPSSGA